MMILTREKIKELIEKGDIEIDPFSEENLGPASYDVTLSDKIYVFEEIFSDIDSKIIEEDPRKLYEDYLVEVNISRKPYKLKPGELILGITRERIKIPENVCGFITGRSRFARIGLMVHVSASFIQPGVNNHQVFEIYNASHKNIILRPNLRIAQIIFCKCEGKGKYLGVWKDQ